MSVDTICAMLAFSHRMENLQLDSKCGWRTLCFLGIDTACHTVHVSASESSTLPWLEKEITTNTPWIIWTIVVIAKKEGVGSSEGTHKAIQNLTCCGKRRRRTSETDWTGTKFRCLWLFLFPKFLACSFCYCCTMSIFFCVFSCCNILVILSWWYLARKCNNFDQRKK